MPVVIVTASCIKTKNDICTMYNEMLVIRSELRSGHDSLPAIT